MEQLLSLIRKSHGWKEDTSVSPVVTVDQHLDHGAVLANWLHGRVTEVLVGDA